MTTTTRITEHIEFAEGARTCTIARDGARLAYCRDGFAVPIWTGGIYQAVRRKSDGVLTWRRVGSYGGTRSGIEPSRAYVAELIEGAPCPWALGGVVHGERVRTRTECITA